MASGKVLYATHAGVHVLRFQGEIGYALGPDVQRFVDGLFTGAPPLGFVLDLRETTHIDSTNLGLLASISNRMRERHGPPVTLVSDRDDINEILYNMGFDEVFDIVADTAPPSAEARALPIASPDGARLSRTMLEAHRTLMAMNERNRQEFADVVSLLELQQESQATQ